MSDQALAALQRLWLLHERVDDALVGHCSHCFTDDGHPQPWPCDTAHLLYGIGSLDEDQRDQLTDDTRRRCRFRYQRELALTDDQVDDTVALTLALYETAAGYGISRGDADGATSLIDTAMDAIKLRDSRRRRRVSR